MFGRMDTNKSERPHTEWQEDIHRLEKGIIPGVEESRSDGQKELEELGEDGIGHLRALSPRCLMMMNLVIQ